MRYRTFELIVLGLGAIAVLSAVAMSAVYGNVGWETIVGELLILPVLAAAVHWGPNGGFIAAAVTIVFYVILTVFATLPDSGVKPPLTELVILLMLSYGAVGIVGGEFAARMKYTLSQAGGGSALDAETRLYSEPVVRRLVESGLGRSRRYSTAFSLAIISVPVAPLRSLKPMERRVLLKRTADRVRDEVRLVDDVGRLDDGRLVVMLPSTAAESAGRVADRVATVIARSLKVDLSTIGVEILAADIDADSLERFAGSLRADHPPAADGAMETA